MSMIQTISLQNNNGILFAHESNTYSANTLLDGKGSDVYSAGSPLENTYQSFQKELMNTADKKNTYQYSSKQQEKQSTVQQNTDKSYKEAHSSYEDNTPIYKKVHKKIHTKTAEKQKDTDSVSKQKVHEGATKEKEESVGFVEQAFLSHVLQEKKLSVHASTHGSDEESTEKMKPKHRSTLQLSKHDNEKESSIVFDMLSKYHKKYDKKTDGSADNFTTKEATAQKGAISQENLPSSFVSQKEQIQDTIETLIKESNLSKEKNNASLHQTEEASSVEKTEKETSLFSQLQHTIKNNYHKKKYKQSLSADNKNVFSHENASASSQEYAMLHQQISLETQGMSIPRKVSLLHNAQNQLQNFIQNDFMKQARLLIHPNASGEIKIALQPRELGDVKYTIKLDKNSISAKVVVESDAVKELVLKSIEQLSKQFLQEGYEIGNFTVSVDSKNTENNTNDKDELPKQLQQDKEIDLLGYVADAFEGAYVGVSDRINLIA